MAATKIDLDYILMNELGQFGKFQAFTLALVAIPIIFSAFGQDYIFSASSLPTRCLIPECEGPDAVYNQPWILNAVPGSSSVNFDNCNRYVNTTTIQQPDPGTCPATLFNQQQTISCDSYIYERTNSIVYDFGIECNEWLRALIGTLNSVGTLLVLPVTGYISDRFGRKIALIVNAINSGLVGLIRSQSVNYYMFAALHLLQTTLGAGAFSSGFIIATELVGPKYRVPAGIFCSTLFAIGQTILGLIAWALPEWRHLHYALYGPQFFILIGYFWFISESVRWLLSKKKHTEAEAVLMRAARFNNKIISEKSLQGLFVEEETTELKPDINEPSLIAKIFKTPVMLRRVCTTPVWWVTTTLIYYGLSINATGLVGNMYLNYILVCLIEIPGYWSAFFLLSTLGRKWTLFSGYFTCALCQVAFILIPSNLGTLSLIVYLVGKFAISLVFTSVYIYTAELYPTSHRHSLLAFSSMVGRVGSITAPLTPALMVYWSGLPSLIFAVMAFLSAGLTLTTPETLGQKLPDTFEDAVNIGKNKSKKLVKEETA